MAYEVAGKELDLGDFVSYKSTLVENFWNQDVFCQLPVVGLLIVLELEVVFLHWGYVISSFTFICTKHLILPDCTVIPELDTSMTRPSSTSSTSGMHVIALKGTLKITSPLVSCTTPSPILQSGSFWSHLEFISLLIPLTRAG